METTRVSRASSAGVRRRIAPPLPEASIPSNTRTVRIPADRAARWRGFSRARSSCSLRRYGSASSRFPRSNPSSTFGPVGASLLVGCARGRPGGDVPLQGPLQPDRDVGADLEAASADVASVDHAPRTSWGRRSGHQKVGGVHERVVHTLMLPVARMHPPRREWILRETSEPRFLLLLVQVHPVLEDECPIRCQRVLELGDPPGLRLQLGVVGAAVGALQKGLGVPGLQEDPHGSARRQVPPEAPEFGTLPLILGGARVGVRPDTPRVHPLGQEIGEISLSGPVDTGEDEENWEVRLRQARLCSEETLAERRYALLVFLCGHGWPGVHVVRTVSGSLGDGWTTR